MQYLEELLIAEDGHEIPVRVWRPNKVDNIMVIAHGIAEYCERYAQFAEWLTDQNVAVVALNHRGHGMDCPDEELGYFADHFGWQKVIDDLHQTIEFAKKEMPDVPVSLYGMSMGSFVAQCYVQQHPKVLSNLILVSTNRIDRPKIMVSLLMLSFLKFYKGKRATSRLVNFLSLGVLNKPFKPERTGYEWLNRKEDEVDEYVADPFCGFSCSILLWQDFISGMLTIKPASWPSELPVHLLSGGDDAVGEFGKGVGKLAEQLKKSAKNLKNFKIYPGARHELSLEENAMEFWQDVNEILKTGEVK